MAVAPGRYFGKREAAAFVGGLIQRRAFGVRRTQHHLRAAQCLSGRAAENGSLNGARCLGFRGLRGRRRRYRGRLVLTQAGSTLNRLRAGKASACVARGPLRYDVNVAITWESHGFADRTSVMAPTAVAHCCRETSKCVTARIWRGLMPFIRTPRVFSAAVSSVVAEAGAGDVEDDDVGLDARRINLDARQLRQFTLPGIAHWHGPRPAGAAFLPARSIPLPPARPPGASRRPVVCDSRARDRWLPPVPTSMEPTGAPKPLRQAKHHGIRGRGQIANRPVQMASGVEDARAVQMHFDAAQSCAFAQISSKTSMG